MNYTNPEIIEAFFKSHYDFYKPETIINDSISFPISIVLGDYIYITCYIRTLTDINYDIIYDPLCNSTLKTKLEAFNEGDHWSSFNRNFNEVPRAPGFIYDNQDINNVGKGAALVILDKSTLSINKVYYFKDCYCLDVYSRIIDVVAGKVVVNYFEYNYVFENDEFLNLSFANSNKYLKLDYLWIAYPFCGYDAGCEWQTINFKNNIVTPIYALTERLEEHPSFVDYRDDKIYCWYDFEKCLFIFSSDTESLAMDYKTLCIDKDKIHHLCYRNIGSKNGLCSIEEPDIDRQLFNELFSCVTSWDSHMESNLKHKYFYDYYNYNRHKDCATSSMWDTWHTVWNFKNDPAKGVPKYEHESALRKVIELVESSLHSTFGSKTEYLTLVCLTASTQRKTELRFKRFAEKVCSDLKMTNAYPYIHVVEDGSAKHNGGDGSRKVSHDSSFFRDKYVVLFDDVRTSGRSLEQERLTLERFGAKVICAITIAQTISALA